MLVPRIGVWLVTGNDEAAKSVDGSDGGSNVSHGLSAASFGAYSKAAWLCADKLVVSSSGEMATTLVLPACAVDGTLGPLLGAEGRASLCANLEKLAGTPRQQLQH